MNKFIEEARQIAAQCWCDKETEHLEMDVILAEVIARKVAAWMETGADYSRNADYYRGLLVECGEAIGEESRIQDDGNRSYDVLCAKIPELVAVLVKKKNSNEATEYHKIQTVSRSGERVITKLKAKDFRG